MNNCIIDNEYVSKTSEINDLYYLKKCIAEKNIEIIELKAQLKEKKKND